MVVQVVSPHASEESSEMRDARWLLGVLALATDVVGKDTVLGSVLLQTRNEVCSLVQAREGDSLRRSTEAA